MGSEGSSSPALRTYFVAVYFTGTRLLLRQVFNKMGIWTMGHTYIPINLFIVNTVGSRLVLISFYSPTLSSMLMTILNSRVSV